MARLIKNSLNSRAFGSASCATDGMNTSRAACQRSMWMPRRFTVSDVESDTFATLADKPTTSLQSARPQTSSGAATVHTSPMLAGLRQPRQPSAAESDASLTEILPGMPSASPASSTESDAWSFAHRKHVPVSTANGTTRSARRHATAGRRPSPLPAARQPRCSSEDHGVSAAESDASLTKLVSSMDSDAWSSAHWKYAPSTAKGRTKSILRPAAIDTGSGRCPSPRGSWQISRDGCPSPRESRQISRDGCPSPRESRQISRDGCPSPRDSWQISRDSWRHNSRTSSRSSSARPSFSSTQAPSTSVSSIDSKSLASLATASRTTAKSARSVEIDSEFNDFFNDLESRLTGSDVSELPTVDYPIEITEAQGVGAWQAPATVSSASISEPRPSRADRVLKKLSTTNILGLAVWTADEESDEEPDQEACATASEAKAKLMQLQRAMKTVKKQVSAVQGFLTRRASEDSQ
eukprot:gnl/TRDRNA2_/TRDRNA2_153969_c0_seq1.p1 gnl/TRDRNA2_/TRDRNA2_153969_c0~~gnl/TRDRNA2_/TRDRNA2_153969_c0_seq1.p1  ORF type:complete len:466 (-),score=43.16 gnl/TRDRNA2_/TRDRNA2_153969_c0_seq1:723-2120(-)